VVADAVETPASATAKPMTAVAIFMPVFIEKSPLIAAPLSGDAADVARTA
jgi:hypothetical protein